MSSTSGPALVEDRAVNIGVGAHIAAASPKGPRYDANMTSAERSSGANGIWLCQSCSKLVDSDDARYTVTLLHQWKKDAIQRALDGIAGGGPLGPMKPPVLFDAADEDFLRGLNLPSADAIEAVFAQLQAATQTDIQAFRAARGRPARTIALTLRLEGSAALPLTLESLARMTALAEPISIVAPGGTGKSTTLVQLAECMSSQAGQIPVLVPLGEWSDRQEDFFDSILRRNAFGRFRRQHLMLLAYQGRLVLLLDGWNELTPEARLRATNDLTASLRDYPQLGIVISSRRQALPIEGPVVAIEALSQDQQMELAQAARQEDGTELLDRAWRTPGVRDLVGNPLYLNALLTLPRGDAFPETKEAVLRMFVQHNEIAPERLERLQRDTLGQHTAILTGLAAEANRSANTAISDSNANRTISTIVRRLSEDGQIGGAPQPRAILDGLVGAHLLVRSVGNGGAVSFQHQLFQEWYAATEAEDLMLKAARGDMSARKMLREDVLDRPSWEESVLFACERLSRASADGVSAVVAAIDDALGIDPLLAAAMLDRATDAVWIRLRERVLHLIRRWHAPGAFDRAVRFMVISGKPEFADMIWPLASSTDDQIQLETFRAADRFRPSVLGADRDARLQALPARQRKIALSEIASNSGFDGMELAATLVAADSDPEVVVAVVQALAFRRGDRHVNRIMQAAPDDVWKALCKETYPYHLTDAQLDTRLATGRDAVHSTKTHPIFLLGWITDEKPADAEARITQLLGTSDVESKDMNFEHAVAHAFREYPGAVAAGLIARIGANLPLPYRTEDYLKDAQLLDTGPVAEAAREPSTPERRLNAAAAVIGPATVAELFDQLFAIDDQMKVLDRYEQQLSNAHNRLVSALSATQQNAFIPTLITKAQTKDPRRIGLLADVLARHGGNNGDLKPPIGVAHLAALRAVVEDWITILQTTPQPARYASSEVARAAGRLANAELAEPLSALLERDLADYATAKAAHLAARGRGVYDVTGYTLMYAQAFAAMHGAQAVTVLKRGLGDVRWGTDAAGALYQIWSDDYPPKERPILGSTSYSQHLTRRAERAAQTPPSSDFAEAIFDVVRTLGKATKSDSEQQHAVALAVTGLSLPHGSKRSEIDTLLALPLPITHKQRLLAAAARAGEIIPATLLMEGIQNLLAAAQTEAWRLDENRGELMGWIDLFPFSDHPERVHDAIAVLPELRQRPHQLRRLLETIPQGPVLPALATLERLAADNPAFRGEFEWLNALLRLDSETAALSLLDQLCSGYVPIRDGFRLSGALTAWARRFTNVRVAIVERYRGLPAGDIRRVLEMAMDDLTDEDIFMALFDGHVDAPHPFSGVAHAIRNLAIGKRPSEEWTGAFEEFGLPLTGLRARLFAMLPAKDARAKLAKECLIAIEYHRDDRGRVANEPRHPDIASGRAWPPEADE